MAEAYYRYRLAKPSDAKTLAHVHWTCAAEQPGSFFYQLGKSFLSAYYQVLLNEKCSIVLCAVDQADHLVGFTSGSLHTQEHAQALRRFRITLGLASLPAVLKRPGILTGLISRQKLQSADSTAQGYIVLHGAREEYWAWLPQYRSMGGAIELHHKWLELVYLLGAQSVRLEVDGINQEVKLLHQRMGARVIKELITPDGKQRMIMEYNINHNE